MTMATGNQLRQLLGQHPEDGILDELADRIAARLRSPEKLTLSVNEAAERLNICPNTVRECLHTRQLPGIKLQGRWFISVPALMEWLKNPPQENRGKYVSNR